MKLVPKLIHLFLLLPKTSALKSSSFLPFRVSKPRLPLPLSPKSAWICPCSQRRNTSVLGRGSFHKTMRAQARRKLLASPAQALSSNLCLYNAPSPFANLQSILKFNIAIFCLKSVVGTRKRLLLFAGFAYRYLRQPQNKYTLQPRTLPLSQRRSAGTYFLAHCRHCFAQIPRFCDCRCGRCTDITPVPIQLLA